MSPRNYDIEFTQTVLLIWALSTVLTTFKNIVVYKITDILFKGRSNYTHQKATMSIYKIFSYSFIAFYGLMTLRKEEWIWDSASYVLPYCSGPLPFRMTFYYNYEFVFYFLEFMFLLVHYDMKDRNQMLTHHIVTLLLIGGSGLSGYIRYGVVIMAIHDIGDPFLECAKLFMYLGWKKYANFVFIIFTFVFIVSRLMIFPSVIIYSLFCRMRENYCFESISFFVLLSILQILHVIWFVMILRVTSKVFTDHEVHDIRSNSDVLDKTKVE